MGSVLSKYQMLVCRRNSGKYRSLKKIDAVRPKPDSLSYSYCLNRHSIKRTLPMRPKITKVSVGHMAWYFHLVRARILRESGLKMNDIHARAMYGSSDL